MRKYLEKQIRGYEDELKNLKKRNQESEDVNELRSINEQIDEVKARLDEAKAMLDELKEDGGTESASDDARSQAFDPTQLRAVAQFGEKKSENPRESMEYREAFKSYVQGGELDRSILQTEKRAVGSSSDLGVLIPMTVVQEIIKGVEKVYGQLYSRVKKTSVPGGVKYPIGSFGATFRRITESTVSERQKGGQITGYVEFSYNLGEIRLSRTILETTLTVPVFEEEFAKVIVEAYVEAMDKEIMKGSAANGECEGILTEAAKVSSRIPSGNIIEFDAEEMADWTEWRKKLFAIIPISLRGQNPQFAMTANTFEANIMTLADDNNRPVATDTFNPVDGAQVCKFAGKDVVLVEEDILENFDDAEAGEYFAMYWVPEKAYAINSNMEFTVMDYFDQETNQWIKKALVINDGKILDPKYIYLLKKGS